MKKLSKYLFVALVGSLSSAFQTLTKPCARIVNDTEYTLEATVTVFAKTAQEITDQMAGRFHDKELARITINPGDIRQIESEQEELKSELTLSVNHKGNKEVLRIPLHGYGCQDFAVRSTEKVIYAVPVTTFRHFIAVP